MDLRGKSKAELEQLAYEFIVRDNLNAATEVSDFIKFYEKRVQVVKGRKVPIGLIGTVFFVKRKNYGRYPDPNGVNSATTVGIMDELGNKFYTNKFNVKILE